MTKITPEITVETALSEIRAAMSTVSLIHAQGELSREDVTTALAFVEARCDEIAALTAPAPAFGTTALPILTLAQIGAQARAEAGRATGRRHLRLVGGEGDAA